MRASLEHPSGKVQKPVAVSYRRQRMGRSLLIASLLVAALAMPSTATAQITTVVDTAGNVIGTVDATTGTVLDAAGNVIGTADGTTGAVVDGAGNVIGSVVAGSGGSGGTTGSDGFGDPAASPPAGQVPVDTRPLTLTISSRRAQGGRRTLSRGILARFRCSRACGVLVELRASRRVAKAVGLGSGRRTVRVGFATITRSDNVRLRMTSRARKRISRYFSETGSRGVGLQIRAIAFDATGRPSTLRTRSVTIKP